MVNKLYKWYKTRPGYLVFGLVKLAIAYGFASLSIDRGNFFWYLLTLVFLVSALQNFTKLIEEISHVSRTKR